MRGNEYQELAMKLQNITFNDKNEQLYHAIFNLSLQSSALSLILQQSFEEEEINTDKMRQHIENCLFMIAEMCDSLDCKLEDIMQSNIDKLKDK